MSYQDNQDMLVLRNPGVFHWRSGGEKHINDPVSVANLQVRNILVSFKKLQLGDTF